MSWPSRGARSSGIPSGICDSGDKAGRRLHPGDLPRRPVAVPGQSRERSGRRETAELAPVEPGAPGERLHALEARLAPRLDQPERGGLRKALHEAQTEPQRERPAACGLERAVPVAHVDIDRAHLDAVAARILHELRRRIEPHRLAVDERRREGGRLVTLEPGRDVHEQREARRVGIVNHEVVGDEVVITFDLQIVCRLGPESFDRHDLVPIDIRA